MLIHNSAELKAILLPKIKESVRQTQMQVYDIIDTVLQDFYNDYTPEQYHRTYQLLHSLVHSEIEEIPNGYRATVYFDYTKIDYTNRKFKKKWSGEKEMEFGGVRGLRGYRGKGHSIPIRAPKFWLDPKNEIDNKVKSMLLANLKANGIPIR